MDTTPHHTRPLPHPADHRRAAGHLTLGAIGEEVAAAHLRGLGWELVARNWRIADGELRGELDLVCRDGDALVVVEVKARRSDRHGAPVEAVGHRKQAKLRRLAAAFLRESGIRAREVRFDVVGVLVRGDVARVEHVTAAF